MLLRSLLTCKSALAVPVLCMLALRYASEQESITEQQGGMQGMEPTSLEIEAFGEVV